VLGLLADGLSYAEVAERLILSEKIGNMPDVPPGPGQVYCSRGHQARATSLGRDTPMALFMDTHTIDGPVSIDDVAKAHAADLQTQEAYGVHYLRYWVDQEHGKIFCLVDAPNAEAAATVHREAHGLVADEIYPVAEGA
jgi:hypothetical protein